MITPALAITAASAAANLLETVAGGNEPAPPRAPTDLVNQAEFLQLLITQLQNQDPLNPLDSSNFSAQLAQFSSLEQLTQINGKLDGLGAAGGAPSRFDAVDFLGREVRAASQSVTVRDGAATALDYELEEAAVVQAEILDANGREVRRVVLGLQGAGPHRLDLGGLPDGPALADGTYTVRLSRGDGSGQSVPIATQAGGRVTGVDLGTDPPVLLIGDRRVPLTEVREIHEASSDASS